MSFNGAFTIPVFSIKTPAANGAIRGTEFVVTVGASGKTTVTMLDGELELFNAQGSVLIHNGEQANAEPGRKPTKTAVIEAINVIQWCLYYPGVLDQDSGSERRDTRNRICGNRRSEWEDDGHDA